MDLPTAWNINDKFGYLSVNSDGLRVNYMGKKNFAVLVLNYWNI